jgi:hypothetical protein
MQEARQRQLDDWLGEISDDDWDEQPTARSGRPRDTIAYPDAPAARSRLPDRTAAADVATRRAVSGRRRLALAVGLAAAVGLAVAIPVLALRGDDRATVTPVSEPTSTTPATEPSSSPATTPSTTLPGTTTPTTDDAPAYALPAGVKLQREGEGDPALIRELQRALVAAGYDPGAVDGTFGQLTEAAVVAFQQANGLSVDGRVGPETAEALNRALSRG